MSRVLSCVAKAIDRSASSRACLSSDHLSRSLSVDIFALLDSVSRMRCSKFRMKSRSSCSLSCSDAHSCLTCASKSIFSAFNFRRSIFKSVQTKIEEKFQRFCILNDLLILLDICSLAARSSISSRLASLAIGRSSLVSAPSDSSAPPIAPSGELASSFFKRAISFCIRKFS